MAQLTSVTSAGTGLVGVILPDITSSARYANYDLPYLTQAFTAAGYATSDFKIDNARARRHRVGDAQADITPGAKVLSSTRSTARSARRSRRAAAAGVTLISYDRATFQGTNTYYVSFDNVQVGKLIGMGFCSASRTGASPARRSSRSTAARTPTRTRSTSPRATTRSFGATRCPGHGWRHQQRRLRPSSATRLPRVGTTPRARPSSSRPYTAHPEINATIEANDGLANAVITVLKQKMSRQEDPDHGPGRQPRGHGKHPPGYQCGSVYKPIYLEAQDAVALATSCAPADSSRRSREWHHPPTRPSRSPRSPRRC